ncbi:MAG: NUDIX hydrolase [Candidatus Hodarchaeales archaeon]
MVHHKLATLCYITYNNELLLLYRNKKKNDFHHNKYVAIGGRLEPGETPLECVIREVEEETDYSLTPNEVIFRGYIYFDDINRNKSTQDLPAYNWLVFMYKTEVEEKIISDNDEGELHWFNFEDIPYRNMWEGDRYFTPKILNTTDIIEGKFIYDETKIVEWSFG